jgi:hypothetical protein
MIIQKTPRVDARGVFYYLITSLIILYALGFVLVNDKVKLPVVLPVQVFIIASVKINSVLLLAVINTWTGSTTGNLTLSFTSTQREKIMFTDSSSVVHDSAATIVDNTTYTIGTHSLTIDVTDI